ncbi:MAG: aldehyde dehydrogenase (NADP(+)), partial [Gammaproteobacteria bacterium]|nr:aldehyde dehydrogenase (NADP(+)) [Gammaproteobacteria bacterium]
LAQFEAAAASAFESTIAATMLSAGIHGAYCRGVERLSGHERVKVLARGRAGAGANQTPAALFSADAAALLGDAVLQDEVFGAASLLVRCRDAAEMVEVAERLPGQLTSTMHVEDADLPLARRLLAVLERKAGRVAVNGFPTGVEVCDAMVHGGPFPSTSDGRSTSVGSLAIRRFLRPVCYQDLPAALVPAAIADGNPLGLWRRLNGELGRH